MTTVELRTSIVAELDQMSAEMLESVQHYVKRLRRHARPTRRTAVAKEKRDAAILFVKTLSVQGGMPVPADDSGDVPPQGNDNKGGCPCDEPHKNAACWTPPLL